MSSDTDSPEVPSGEFAHEGSPSRYSVFACRDCGAVALAVGRDEPALSCHGTPMRELASPEIDTERPELTEVLLEAFGLPKTGVEICLCVIGEGPLSAQEIGDELGYHRSTVTRYLHDLVEIGLLERSELNREGGGVVHVYHSIDIGRMRRETLLGFLVWAGEAATLIEEANLTKEKYLAENPDQQLPELFWESLSDG